ncbi:MAG: intradiol ring-cleavage dioxygenase [Bacteroidota bacterium]
MKRFLQIVLLLFVIQFLTSCNQKAKSNSETKKTTVSNETKPVGGGCDGCEIMYIDMPTNLSSVDTSLGWTERGQKLIVTGKVYQLNGTTPAPNVIIYYWQTDNNGLYSPTNSMNEKAKRHGRIRGWVKTDTNGKFTIYTIRPAPYPNDNLPAHIHLAIKEPDVDTEYYTDELVFDDDKLLTIEKRKAAENRGGSGILKISQSNGIQRAEHIIVLGRNIPNYPKTL